MCIKDRAIKEAQKAFMYDIPILEIDQPSVRMIVRCFRNDLSSEDSTKTLLQKHSNYLLEWHQANKAIDVFYFQTRDNES